MTTTTSESPRESLPDFPAYVACAMGAVMFFVFFGWTLLNPFSVDWLLSTPDASVKYIGWLFYREEPWTWPIGMIRSLNHPEGSSVFNTAQLPLLSIPLKLIRAFLPPHVQYFGLWLLLCHMLQSLFGYKLVASLTRRPLPSLVAALLFLLAPIVNDRTDAHLALAGQWQILAALWLYFRPVPRWHGWTLLLVVAALTHPYLLFMVAVVWISKLTSTWISGERGALPLALHGVAAIALLVVIHWQIGYFQFSIVPGSFGQWGRWPMNLLAPFFPIKGQEFLLPRLAASIDWLRYGQHEGAAYLGAGGLFLVAISLGSMRGRLRWRRRRHLPLAVAALGLSLFAALPAVHLGSLHLFTIPLPDSLLDRLSFLRVSGRLVWPVYYAVLTVAAVVVIRARASHRVPFVLAAAAALQIVDVSPQFWANRGVLQARTWSNPLVSGDWQRIARHYDHIAFVPPWEPVVFPPIQNDYLPFYLLALEHGDTINVGYRARFNQMQQQEKMAEYNRSIAGDTLRGDTVYILNAGGGILRGFRFREGSAEEKPIYSQQTGHGVLDGYFVVTP